MGFLIKPKAIHFTKAAEVLNLGGRTKKVSFSLKPEVQNLGYLD
jgi:hypothetical protein